MKFIVLHRAIGATERIFLVLHLRYRLRFVLYLIVWMVNFLLFTARQGINGQNVRFQKGLLVRARKALHPLDTFVLERLKCVGAIYLDPLVTFA